MNTNYAYCEWSPEIKAQLDVLGFHIRPDFMVWDVQDQQEQEKKWAKDMRRCSVMPWQLAGLIGIWLLTVKGGALNALLFWATLLIVRCYRLRSMLKSRERERNGYFIAKRELFRLMSLGHSGAKEDEEGCFKTSCPRVDPPYETELISEKEAALNDYYALYYFERTLCQGFDIERNKSIDLPSLVQLSEELKQQTKDINDRFSRQRTSYAELQSEQARIESIKREVKLK